jgi:hypothetical protein
LKAKDPPRLPKILVNGKATEVKFFYTAWILLEGQSDLFVLDKTLTLPFNAEKDEFGIVIFHSDVPHGAKKQKDNRLSLDFRFACVDWQCDPGV